MRSSPVATTQAAAEPAASTSPSAMPRLALFSRASPPRTASPLRTMLQPALMYSGDVWLPQEPSYLSFGFGSRWAKTALAVWRAPVVDVPSAAPLLHVRLGGRVAVVTRVHNPARTTAAACSQDEDAKEKMPIVLDAKDPEDMRRAMLYHTAAPASTLAFYVDTVLQRDHLLALLQPSTLSSPPHSIRPPSPPMLAAATPASSTIDSAFAQLEDARAKQQRGHVVDALAAFVSAEQAFTVVENSPIVDVAGRRRIAQARGEIRAAVHSLEMERALPRAAVSIASIADDSPQNRPKSPSTAATSCSSSTIDARLVDLQAFAHGRSVDRAQREHRVAADDLTLRLHALRSENPTVSSMDSLKTRLDRLRGVDVDVDVAADVRTETVVSTTRSLNPVDQIIQQAMDEVALGLVDSNYSDDDDDHDNGNHDDSSSRCSSSSNSISDSPRARQR